MRNYLATFQEVIAPLVNKELGFWRQKARLISDPFLSSLAQWSIKTKAFHSLGAAIFATPLPRNRIPLMVSTLVAFETMADFLDTLCDRAGLSGEDDFARLHQAMVDSLSLRDPPKSNPLSATHGYLSALAAKSQVLLKNLPGYKTTKPFLGRAARLYARMQTLTHLPVGEREKACQVWFDQVDHKFTPPIAWWEFVAAGGSTLSTFSLVLAAHNPGLKESEACLMSDAYYPWMNGANILFDSFIDQGEDDRTGDMNFMRYYPNSKAALEGITKFVTNAWERVGQLEDPDFHHFVLQSMVNLYIQKALKNRRTRKPAQALLREVQRSRFCKGDGSLL